MKVFGVVGWKNSGKTGLMERLVKEITQRGFSVSTIKHAHHGFDIDQEGTDSFRHRAAGAQEVMLSSGRRWALMHELRNEDEASLDQLLTHINPVDLVLVEGYKTEGHAKIECHRGGSSEHDLLALSDPSIRAFASDVALNTDIKVFNLDDTKTITDFVLAEVGLI